MIQINIKKQNVITNSAQFLTQEEADAWLNQEVSNGSFGKSERWVRESISEDISNAIDTREVEDNEEIIMEYLLEAEYSIEQEDVSEQIAVENRVADGLKRQSLGAEVIAKVYSINEGKNISAQTFQAMMADASLERIERLLWTGSLRTAKLMIQSLDNTYFTNDEKNSILQMLTDF